MSDNPSNKLDGDVRTAAVMQCSVFDLEEAVDNLQRGLGLMRGLNQCSLQILKAFGDLYLELTEKSVERRFIEKTIRRVEREAARTRLPLWFWRPEPELDVEAQLARRARFLIEEAGLSVDDQWDLLREYVDDWAKADVSDDCITYTIDRLHVERRDA